MSKRKADDRSKEAPPPQPQPLPPFEHLRAHLEKLQSDRKLVDLLREAWDSDGHDDDMRRVILSGLGGWAPVSDPNEMLKHDWVVQNSEESDDDDGEERGIQLNFASNNVRLGCYSSVKKVDKKQCSGGSYVGSGRGCQECSGDEVYNFDMERRLDGTTRLKVHYYVTCRCGCMRGDDSDHCEEMDYIAVPRNYPGGGPASK